MLPCDAAFCATESTRGKGEALGKDDRRDGGKGDEGGCGGGAAIGGGCGAGSKVHPVAGSECGCCCGGCGTF